MNCVCFVLRLIQNFVIVVNILVEYKSKISVLLAGIEFVSIVILIICFIFTLKFYGCYFNFIFIVSNNICYITRNNIIVTYCELLYNIYLVIANLIVKVCNNSVILIILFIYLYYTVIDIFIYLLFLQN